MKVILTETVHGLGGRGDIVTVKNGYARNYLFPKQLAREATSGNMKVVEQQKIKWVELEKAELNEAKSAAERIENAVVKIEKRVGDAGTLYGSVTTAEIAEALEAQGIEVDKRRIEMPEAIKTVGEHELNVKIHRDVSATLKVEVVPAEESV